MLNRFAVIGNPVSHSLSPQIHQAFAMQFKMHLTYEKIKGEDRLFEKQVIDFFDSGAKGMNVTLPFKSKAYNLANKTTTRCKQAGVANTLWMEGQQLCADNTDGIGLIRDLAQHLTLSGKNILILGAGGAARGVIQPLLDTQPAQLVLANRGLEKAAAMKKDFPLIKCVQLHDLTGDFDLIINATSASLAGELVVVPAECLLKKPFCYDLAYQQKGLTAFVQYAQSQGCEAIDGLGMLVEQAACAFQIWHEVMPDSKPVLRSLRQQQALN